MSRIIIGIHGLDNKPPKELLEKWWIKSINEGFAKINKKVKSYDFELVYWADIFHKEPLNPSINDKDNPHFIDEPYIKSPANILNRENSRRKKILGFLEQQMDKIFLNDDFTPNFTFLSDLIFKNYFEELAEYYKIKTESIEKKEIEFKDHVRNRLAKILKKHKKKEILLIAHSMGSIIAYDVLMFLVPEIKINTLITIGSPLGMSVILSKIAEEIRENKLHFDRPRTPDNITDAWYNFSDIEDNVAMNYNLSDDFVENEKGIKVIDQLVTNDYINDKERNPHKSFGYLRSKELSEVLNDFISKDATQFEIITSKVINKVKNIFNKIFKK